MGAEKIGFLGLGSLGKPMAVKVAEAGLDLTVFDVRAGADADLIELGAKRARSPIEVAQSCDIIQIMVGYPDQVRDVIVSPTGLLAAARPDTLIVIHSTVGPDLCEEMASICKPHGVRVLDAAVSGSVPRAQTKSLTLMVGGSSEDLLRCRELFSAFASNVYHLGKVGNGQLTKVLNNHAGLCNLFALNEVLKVAQKAGVPPDDLLVVVNSSAGASWMSENWKFLYDLRLNFVGGPKGNSDMIGKDLRLALEIAHKYGVPAPAAALAAQFVSTGLGSDEVV
jgi:3-hydroxyisobutyrate dehydrogenase